MVQAGFGQPFTHLLWRRYWATFAERSRIAQQLACSPAELDAALQRHPWELQAPPALGLQENDLTDALGFGGGMRARLEMDDFVSNSGGTTPSVATRV